MDQRRRTPMYGVPFILVHRKLIARTRMSTPDLNPPFQNDLSIEHSQKSADNVLYEKAVMLIAQKQTASTSFLQRNLDIGYDAAANLINRLESDGLIGKADGIHKRAIFVAADAKLDGTIYENR